MKNLDLRAIDTCGPTLIEASAGTGKTWTITALYTLLLLEQRLRPEEILVVTYTKAATAELRDRIRKRIAATLDLYATGREPADELEQLLLDSPKVNREAAQLLLTRALYSFDDAAIFTIHGFCQRALLENAFESGSLFDSELTADQSALAAQVCDDFWRTRIMADTGPFLERLVREGYTPDKLAAPFEGQYQNPDLNVIPEAVDVDLARLAGQRDALLPPVAAMWAAERAAIVQILNQANLSQTSYKPAQIEAAAAKLDVCLGQGNLDKGSDGLALFTPARIEKGMKKGSARPEHLFFDLCGRLHDAVVRVEDGFDTKLIHRRIELKAWLRDELARRKQALNLRCYDDLLLDLHLALEGPGGARLAAGLRERYQAALIDEFQDTDPLQWRIFARLAGLPAGNGAMDRPERGTFGTATPEAPPYPLFLIGDPKQAIYSFRGADIHAYLAAARATAADRRWTLDTNRRSTPPLVAAVNALFDTGNPFLNPGIRFNPVQAGRQRHQHLLRHGRPVEQPLRFWVYQRADQSKPAAKGTARGTTVTATAAEIARLLDGKSEIIPKDGIRRPLKPGDMAILVKAHYQADQMQSALAALGIPSVQHGNATIFETREALDLLRILRAAADPGRSALIREALLTSVVGLSANDVFALQHDETAWEVWLFRFRTLHEAAQTGGVIALVSRLLGECGVRRQALASADGPRRMTNILHCCELLHQAEQEQGRGLEGSIAWLERRITGEMQDDTFLLRLETDANAVTISTIHASKGLEYPVVFLPFAWDPPSAQNRRVLFHDASGKLTLDLGSDKRDTDHRQLAREEQDAEAARLLYVALTRAEFLCYVAWGGIKGAFESPLRRLLHGEDYRDAKSFGAAPDQEILAALAGLAGKAAREGGPSPIAAGFMPADTPAPPYSPDRETSASFACRGVQRTIAAQWRVSSFSAITDGAERHLQPRDYDAVAAHDAPPAMAEPPAGTDGPPAGFGTDLSIFGFPRGAAAGTCLHELFEQLDFSAVEGESLERLCQTVLLRNGYDGRWLPAVQRMVMDIVAAPLLSDEPGFSLSRLKPGSWQVEMEFFLPVASLSGGRLAELFAGLLSPDRHGGFGEILAALHVQETRGMLQGFMDMVFEHNGRFYIIDWKSNHLGGRPGDYSATKLLEPMARHAYILQYHLYTLALDRLLRLRLPGYEYDTHFGGAIYVFLRGIVAGSAEYGIYRDKPSPLFISRANELLLGSGEAGLA
ncbi:exodeoxyribonuclease V subunit beta [Geobacter sp. FeAm09]|uniref:exodeoxyribonuclease V subunit beta n=1 Tax=Geobacter sp. FeAm09 TaxID=2597769 RepID=UPI0011ECA130|nr:exodeoxyribonuclease V subunit beta [Geobacter sp. FeAm09]QEM68788.1 exodeoxyribonuclease V subunit beta [Geobacter sp. FeAm09]